MTVQEAIENFIQNRREHALEDLKYYRGQKTLALAICEASLCRREDKKRQLHQRRIPKTSLEQAELRLQAIKKKLQKAGCFDELYDMVKNEIEDIRKIGPLAIYDISHRIGAFLEIEPQHVYLHAGTRAGAKLFNINGNKCSMAAFPEDFSRLKPYEVEDFLCIYRNCLSDNIGCDRPRDCSRSKRHSAC